MNIWVDSQTGKKLRFGVAIAKRLREKGHTIVHTSRLHPDTISLAKILNEVVTVIGEYDSTSKLSRLRESLKRELEFTELFKDNLPDIAISQCSVEQIRVAYRLGIPTIATFDTPRVEWIKKLVFPLLNHLIVSDVIPLTEIGYSYANILHRFSGVDEVAWVQNSLKINYDLPHPLIVVRDIETQASYAKNTQNFSEKFVKKLETLGFVLTLPRYQHQDIYYDGLSLVAQADLVVGVGGTLCREACLQGTPAVWIKTFTQQYVDEWLYHKGFPIFPVNMDNAFGQCKDVIGKKVDGRDKLEQLENPVDVIEEIVEKDG